MFNIMQLIEDESIFFYLFPILAVTLVIILIERCAAQGEQVEVICVTMDNPNSGIVYNRECPVCLEEIIFGLEASCGHVCCGRCVNELESRLTFGRLLTCPLCRRTIDLFFKHQRNEEDEFPEALTRQMEGYNAYSLVNFPPNVWQTIKNMPVLLRHLFRRIRERGFQFDSLQISVCVCFLLTFIYFILPQDFLPESVFGIYGLIDDIVVIFYCLFHLCVLYRNILGNTVET